MSDQIEVADHHAEEDENYFVSMTDMMVGVLFIFIILLMVFALNFRQQTDISKEQIERLEQAAKTAKTVRVDLDVLQEQVRSEIAAIAAADAVRGELLRTLEVQLREAGLDVQVDIQNGVLRLGKDAINFQNDSAELDTLAASRVDLLGQVLATVLPAYSAGASERASYLETVFVEGHTDYKGGAGINWPLSTERAVNTFARLVQTQPNLLDLRNRADTPVVSVAGYASTRPVPGRSIEELDIQRRIELRFVMDVDNAARLQQVLEMTGQMRGRLDELGFAVDEAINVVP